MTLRNLVLLLGACLLLQGCASGSVESGWKSTKSFYYGYINTPAAIDYEDKGSLSEAETALSRRMRGMDEQLRALERAMANSDKPANEQVVGDIVARFPWLSGVLLLDVSGEILAQHPAPMKSLDFRPMLDLTGRNGDARSLRGYVQDSVLGSETALAIPVYRDAEFMGLFIAHFDMRALVAYGDESEELVVIAPEAPLWTGRFNYAETPLAVQNWKDMVRSNALGTVSDANGQFLWLVRYLGTQPLIFAVPSKGEFASDSNPMQVIGAGSSRIAPVMDYDPARGGATLLDSPPPLFSPLPGSISETPVEY